MDRGGRTRWRRTEEEEEEWDSRLSYGGMSRKKHSNSRYLVLNTFSPSLRSSMYVSKCVRRWKRGGGEQDGNSNHEWLASLGSAIFFSRSRCCHCCLLRGLSVVASSSAPDVMKHAFKVWLRKKNESGFTKKHFCSFLFFCVCCSLPFCTPLYHPIFLSAHRHSQWLLLVCQCLSAVNRTKLTKQ